MSQRVLNTFCLCSDSDGRIDSIRSGKDVFDDVNIMRVFPEEENKNQTTTATTTATKCTREEKIEKGIFPEND